MQCAVPASAIHLSPSLVVKCNPSRRQTSSTSLMLCQFAKLLFSFVRLPLTLQQSTVFNNVEAKYPLERGRYFPRWLASALQQSTISRKKETSFSNDVAAKYPLERRRCSKTPSPEREVFSLLVGLGVAAIYHLESGRRLSSTTLQQNTLWRSGERELSSSL